jgi:translation initiation factor IF-2
MTENKIEKKSTLSLSSKGKLGLKKPLETSNLLAKKGKGKAVTVEVKRKRLSKPQEAQVEPPKTVVEKTKEIKKSAPAVAKKTNKSKLPLHKLSEAERAERLQKLQDSLREEEQKEQHELESNRKEAESRKKRQAEKEREEAKNKQAEEEKKLEEAKKQQAAQFEEPKPEVVAKPTKSKTYAKAPDEDNAQDSKKKYTKNKSRGSERDFSRKKVTRYQISSDADDADSHMRKMVAQRRSREKERKRLRASQNIEHKKIIHDVIITETITVRELANRMAEKSSSLIRELMKMNIMAGINHVIDAETAELIVTEFGHNPVLVSDDAVEENLTQDEGSTKDLVKRAPVVTVMGHVDHGKTSLLDALRSTDVVKGEAGGITQHIGAYSIKIESGDRVTFIDTPGHAAFSEMRARGANVTDIVILVVAADDGVKQQTIEAIHHAKAANVPMIVAINKIDKPGADPSRVANELLQHEIVLESMGGDTQSIEVSAKERLNLDQLMEAIVLQAEILELQANPKIQGQGAVVESRLEIGRGALATVLVQKGTLRIGDIFVSGSEWGRIRALVNDRGQNIKEAGPSEPVEVIGFNAAPVAGDDFVVVENEAKAREVADHRLQKQKDARAVATGKTKLEQLFEGESSHKQFDVIIKGDVHGSIEAIKTSLEKLSTDEVKLNVIYSGVGGINESDITLGQASAAFVIGFNVRANKQARNMASKDGIEIRYYSIIYNVIDDIKDIMSGLLEPELKENFLGYAEIRQVFNITKVGKVAGCFVTDGTVKRGCKVRLLRDDVVIHEGELRSLKRFKDEVKEVKEGYECGLAFENYNDLQEKDMVECFEIEKVARSL